MLKKFLVGSVVALALLVGVTASAADFGTTTLKVGSKGEAVKAVQVLVGATPADGVFGKMTAAKVKVWQAANGLKADGVFGAASRAKAAGAVVTVPTGTLPAGCAAATGFSSTTGLPCTVVTTLPAGCVAGGLFSATTGLSCTGGTTPSTGGALTGAAGSISPTVLSTDVVSTVAAGNTEKVYGFKVQASDSDVSITNLKVAFVNNGASTTSNRLSNYASTVSVYMNGTKVGSADVADFVKDNSTYSKSIALSNAVVRMGASNKATFYVEVTANSVIDSTDATGDLWNLAVSNVRYQDATGVILTDNSGNLTSKNFDFSSQSSDLKLTISKGSSSPIAQNVEVSKTSTKDDVLMLEFKLKAEGSDINFDQVKLALTSTGASLPNILGELALKNGSTVLGTDSTFAVATSDTAVIALDNLFTVKKDTTETFRVYAKINQLNNNYASGSSVTVSFNGTGTNINAQDVNGKNVGTFSGSVTGAAQSFRTTGAAVTYVSDAYTPVDVSGTTPVAGTISLKFTVSAFGDSDVVINETQVNNAVAAAGVVVNSISGATASGNGIITSSDITKDSVAGTFTVTAGSTGTFTLSRKFLSPVDFIRLSITSVDQSSVSNIITAAH